MDIRVKPKSVIRLSRRLQAFFLSSFYHSSVTMEPHCALKVLKNLFKKKT